MLQLKDDNRNDLPQEVQDRVNSFIDKLPTIPWFNPSKDLKKSDVEKQINFTLECFGIKAGIEYKTLKSEEDWSSARNSAWASARASAWDSARNSAWDSVRNSVRNSAMASAWASAWDSARDSAWASARASARASAMASAWASAWDSARASAWDSARDSAWASARASAWDSAWACSEILVQDNEEFKNKYPNGAFKQLFKLWEMGLYPVGILKDTGKFTVYVPDIDLDTWGDEEEKLPVQGDMIDVRDKSWNEGAYTTCQKFVGFYEGRVIVDQPRRLKMYDEWRFPQEEVTLSDGNTYLVEERDGEKILKLKN